MAMPCRMLFSEFAFVKLWTGTWGIGFVSGVQGWLLDLPCSQSQTQILTFCGKVFAFALNALNSNCSLTVTIRCKGFSVQTVLNLVIKKIALDLTVVDYTSLHQTRKPSRY